MENTPLFLGVFPASRFRQRLLAHSVPLSAKRAKPPQIFKAKISIPQTQGLGRGGGNKYQHPSHTPLSFLAYFRISGFETPRACPAEDMEHPHPCKTSCSTLSRAVCPLFKAWLFSSRSSINAAGLIWPPHVSYTPALNPIINRLAQSRGGGTQMGREAAMTRQVLLRTGKRMQKERGLGGFPRN